VRESILTRVFLSILLLYFVYGETGWATTLCFLFMCVNNEMVAKILKHKQNKP